MDQDGGRTILQRHDPADGQAPPPSIRAQHTPVEIFGLLDRLEIDRYGPWVWMTTEGPVSPDHARFRVYDGWPKRYFPLSPADATNLDGYSLELLGIRLTEGDPYYGRIQFWEDQPTDVRYMRVRYQQSPLYAEYTATKRDGQDAAIRGFHRKQLVPRPPRRAVEHAVKGMGLLFDLGQGPGGRPTNREKANPAKVALAKRAWEIKARNSRLGWDQVKALLVTKYAGKTLQRWVERDRLHEL